MAGTQAVFITGATGSIGYYLAKRFSDSGQRVRALVRNPPRAEALKALPNVELASGDITQSDSMRGCLDGCSLVLHCAAALPGARKADFYATNVAGTQALMAEAISAGVERFVHLSTIGVYAFSKAENIGEDFPFPPCRVPYVTTKREAEQVVRSAAGQIQIAIARVGDVFGPAQFTWTTNFILQINGGIMQPPTAAASGYLNLVYIDNLVDALLLLGSHHAAAGQTFNVVDGWPMRSGDYIRRLMKMAGKRPIPVPGLSYLAVSAFMMSADVLRGREPAVTIGSTRFVLHKITVSNDKLRQELGWKPAVDREEAFRRTEQWLRANSYIR